MIKVDRWIPLSDVKHGDIHLMCEWRPAKPIPPSVALLSTARRISGSVPHDTDHQASTKSSGMVSNTIYFTYYYCGEKGLHFTMDLDVTYSVTSGTHEKQGYRGVTKHRKDGIFSVIF